jgi:hypothetical protein
MVREKAYLECVKGVSDFLLIDVLARPTQGQGANGLVIQVHNLLYPLPHEP